ncbi:SH2 domain-containing protein [Zopfochytrium polystomum]|nr:SH2 domain-containing protein [Zopfochytrium polystomum]
MDKPHQPSDGRAAPSARQTSDKSKSNSNSNTTSNSGGGGGSLWAAVSSHLKPAELGTADLVASFALSAVVMAAFAAVLRKLSPGYQARARADELKYWVAVVLPLVTFVAVRWWCACWSPFTPDGRASMFLLNGAPIVRAQGATGEVVAVCNKKKRNKRDGLVVYKLFVRSVGIYCRSPVHRTLQSSCVAIRVNDPEPAIGRSPSITHGDGSQHRKIDVEHHLTIARHTQILNSTQILINYSIIRVAVGPRDNDQPTATMSEDSASSPLPDRRRRDDEDDDDGGGGSDGRDNDRSSDVDGSNSDGDGDARRRRGADDAAGGGSDSDGAGGGGGGSSERRKKRSKKKHVKDSDDDDDEDDSSEEDLDEEMTEADKQFIVDDEEEEAAASSDDDRREAERRRKKRRKRVAEETLDDEDLELISENYGRPRKETTKRLRKKGANEPRGVETQSSNLADMFDQGEDEDLEEVDERRAPKSRAYDDEISESDAESDFIIDDEVGEDEDAIRDKRREKRRQKERVNLGAAVRAWSKIEELFDDSEYLKYLKLDDTATDLKYPSEADGASKKKTTRITELYEPSEIAEKMLSEGDEAIRIRDIPERLQLRGEHPQLTKDEIRKEAHFIVQKLVDAEEQESERLVSFLKGEKAKDGGRGVNTPAYDRAEKALTYHDEKLHKWKRMDVFTDTVAKILEFFNHNNFEVPFLISHRKDYFAELLDRTDLWKIHDLDTYYHSLTAKKVNLKGLLQDLRVVSEAALRDRYPDRLIDDAKSFEDAQDIMGYLHLHYGTDLQRVEDSRRRTVKRVIKRSPFEDARRAGIDQFVKLFNVDVKAFVRSLTTQDSDYVVEDTKEDPLAAAERFVVDRSAFSTAEKVLEAGRMMLAQEIAADPVLRKFIRRIYHDDAVVTVTPTEKGKREIQYLHPYYPFKYMTKKPVFTFEDARFLQMSAAEAAGLIEISVRVEDEDRLVADIVKNITNDYANEYAERWNDERGRLATKAAREIIFPQMSKWLKEKLASNAAEWLSEQCRLNLEHRIDVAPFKPEGKRAEDDYYDDDGDSDVKNLARVMAISWGDGERDSATLVICLDERGLVVEDAKLKLNWMHDRDRKIDDLNKILVKMREFRPDIVVVAGWTLATSRLMNEIATIVQRINDDDDLGGIRRRDRGRRIHPPELVMIDDDVARMKMASVRFAKEFPESFPPLARYCVSLGRKVQDTTMEYASLFNPDDEIKLLRVHPLQDLLSEEKLKSAFERAFINIVNFNGVDINEAALYPHRSHTLQFVSGLGPRKAKALLTGITKQSSRPLKVKENPNRNPTRLAGMLNSRNDLVLFELLTWKVFLNSASFLRVRRKYFLEFNRAADHDILDDTRIHPEDYDLARKMAADALELDDFLDNEESDSQNVYELMTTKPGKLDDLLLDDYAVELERSNNTKKRITLNEIKDELKAPYRDRRRRFASMTYREMFTMLSTETDETLRPGTVVSCKVIKVLDRLCRIRLNSGLEGIIHVSNLPGRPHTAVGAVSENQMIEAAVKSVDIEQKQVELDARPEVVSRDWMKEIARSTRDEYFDEVREEEDRERRPVPRVVKQKQTRVVNHPFWRNCTFQEAIDELSKREHKNGSIIIRPSTKGNNHLSITWKIDTDLFQHIDVLESNKENEWSLGKTLTIEGRKFDDLDEIIATYIEPLFRNFVEAMSHPKFRKSDLKDMFRWVDGQVIAQKRSSYGVIICAEKPGRLFLVFQHLGSKPRHEYINVVPEGFSFRNVVYKKLDLVFNGFKKAEAAKASEAQKRAGPSSASGSGSGHGGGSASLPPRPTAQPQQQGHAGYYGRPQQVPAWQRVPTAAAMQPMQAVPMAMGMGAMGVGPMQMPGGVAAVAGMGMGGVPGGVGGGGMMRPPPGMMPYPPQARGGVRPPFPR